MQWRKSFASEESREREPIGLTDVPGELFRRAEVAAAQQQGINDSLRAQRKMRQRTVHALYDRVWRHVPARQGEAILKRTSGSRKMVLKMS